MQKFKSFIWKLFILIIGNIICSFAYNSFIMPAQFLSGGLSGISLILDYFFGFPVYWGIILLNIPVIILGFIYLEKSKMIWTIFSIIFSALFIPLMAPYFPALEVDMILAAIFGGLINGFGGGLILKVGCSTGGTDVLGLILKKKKNVSIGSFSIMFNLCMLVIYAFFTPLQFVLYTAICIFISSKVVDTVIIGIVKNKTVTIISKNAPTIRDAILTKLHRGVTIYNGYGGYTHKSEEIIKCVISHYQVPALKEIVREIDPEAFIYITETVEVNGNFK